MASVAASCAERRGDKMFWVSVLVMPKFSKPCCEWPGDERIGVFVMPLEASSCNASRNVIGSSRPLACALRRIPAAARGVKKNLCEAWLSKTSDNEHSAASLGDSEKLAVEHTPRNPIPALDHENAEHFRKVSAAVATEKSGNILEDKPSGSKLAQDSRKLIKEASALPGETGPFAGNRDILAGDARRDATDRFEILRSNFLDIAE